jgi:hypothetical protein
MLLAKLLGDRVQVFAVERHALDSGKQKGECDGLGVVVGEGVVRGSGIWQVAPVVG